MPRRMYKVVAGIHYHRNEDIPNTPENRRNPDKHRVLKVGDVIESDEELDRKFENKFQLVTEAVPVIIASPARKAAVQEMISSGQWSEDDRNFLEGMTEDRFHKMSGKKVEEKADLEKKAPEPPKAEKKPEFPKKGREEK